MIVFAVVSIVVASAENAICGAAPTVTVGDAEYPLPPSPTVIASNLPPVDKFASPVAPPALKETVGGVVYPDPLVDKVTDLRVPVVARVVLAVAISKGLENTDVGCDPPTYPVPAPVILTDPIPFLRTTSDLVEKLDASDDPNTVDQPNPPIFKAP